MKNQIQNSALLLITLMLIFGCHSSENKTSKKNEIILFAAAGSKPVTDLICDSYEKDNDCKVTRNFASSGVLARQIANGAEADVYISANEEWIRYLKKEDLLDESFIEIIGANSLAIIGPVNSKKNKPVFTSDFDIENYIRKNMAIGDPSYVPAGHYAKQALDSLGWYEKIKNRLIQTKDVTSAIRYVEMGECELGIVYVSEALLSSKTKILATFPNHLHSPIHFYVAVIKNGKGSGKNLSSHFTDEGAKVIFKKFGFKTVQNHSDEL